ncbi:type II toxin-antitoxin system HigB family toxin [Novosphingobium sp.]|jgi:mRNA interferase HigB|uniref:type II toxin-antitoxin system HigB family toxin n=1 Tax=Novosphingobium sp. TaxID=1874826 RepID=UPI002FE38C80
MRVISRSTLTEFYKKHPETKASIEHWYGITSRAKWNTPADAVQDFRKAKILDGERVRYEISGGNYRLVVMFRWKRQIAYIRFIGTHKEYDKIDPMTI